ncbi:MAG: M1 family peptidase, partial [Actinomycetota bacterium]|nr:M1 family peptidase [Actinomycetota bacterium]
MRRSIALVTLGLAFAASCSSGSSDSTSPSVTAVTTSVAPTTTAPFTPGASGIGDAYYPGLGNGG